MILNNADYEKQASRFEAISLLVPAVVGFHLEIQQLEGKWKLNQNHDVPRRQRIIKKLRIQPGENARAIAELMEETLTE